MGSFTQATSQEVFKAMFPTGLATLTPATAIATEGAFRIYNSNAGTSSQLGIRCGSAAVNVIHQMTLIIGTQDASGNPAPGVPLVDGNVGSNSLSSTPTPSAGTIYLSRVTGTDIGGQPTYPTTSLSASVAMTSGAWTGWTLSLDGTKARAVNNAPITFPTLGGTAQARNLWGWCITAMPVSAGTAVEPNTATQWLATTPSNSVIIAYGDLSFARRISTGDTPSFTGGAVAIILD
jgi:hypothetical protein